MVRVVLDPDACRGANQAKRNQTYGQKMAGALIVSFLVFPNDDFHL